MICPKCNIEIPNDSAFCPNCGCNIEEEKRKAIINTPPPKTIIIKDKKANRILIVSLILSLIVCVFSIISAFAFYNQTQLFSGEIELLKQENYELDYQNRSLEAKNKILENQNKSLESKTQNYEIYKNVYNTLQSSKNWGYATDNFHANTGIIFLTANGKKGTIDITMNYSSTTCEIISSNTSVADVKWSDKTWYYGETAQVNITPKSKGVCVLTFTNDAYKSTFKVLVVVS